MPLHLGALSSSPFSLSLLPLQRVQVILVILWKQLAGDLNVETGDCQTGTHQQLLCEHVMVGMFCIHQPQRTVGLEKQVHCPVPVRVAGGDTMSHLFPSDKRLTCSA